MNQDNVPEHIQPIVFFGKKIEAEMGLRVPLPDPNDGGVNARLLLLLETPGPSMPLHGKVSRDNPTGTSRNLSKFLNEADIARTDTFIWNAVPFIIHNPGFRNRTPNVQECKLGLTFLPPLLALLPQLKVVVLAGRIAALAEDLIHKLCPHLSILLMPHPSPVYVCTNPTIAKNIISALKQAAKLIK